MKPAACSAEVVDIEYEGRPCGSATTFYDPGAGWVWGWNRLDDIRLTGSGYKTSEEAACGLLLAVREHYGAMN